MNDRILKRDRLSQQLQEQIEAWQALLEKLGGNEWAIAPPRHPFRHRNLSNCCRLRSHTLKSAQRLSDRISEKQVLLVSLHPLSPQFKLSLGMLKLGLSHLSPNPYS
jgi:hypothetical protein